MSREWHTIELLFAIASIAEHCWDSSEVDRRCKSVEVVGIVHLREAARNQPRLVLIETPVCVPFGDENPLASN